jgi:hypothetical protein
MTTLGIFIAGLVVSAITGTGAYFIGLQEDADRAARKENIKE